MDEPGSSLGLGQKEGPIMVILIVIIIISGEGVPILKVFLEPPGV